MSKSERIIIGLIFAVLALPLPGFLILQRLHLAASWADWIVNRTLHGVTIPEHEVAFNRQSWLSGTYQRSITSFVNQHFAFREALIRFYNQILWSGFGKSYMVNESFIQGKHGDIFELGYLQHYNYQMPLLTDSEIERFVDRLCEVKKRLHETGASFVVLITPSKAMLYPNDIPDRYKTNLGNQPPRNYDRLKIALGKRGIPMVDGPAITKNIAGHLPGDAFPKTGVHWSHVTAFYTAEEFLRTCERITGTPLARLRQSSITLDGTPTPPDDDAALVLNLLAPLPCRYMHSTIGLADGSPERQAKLTIVGGSFVFTLADDWDQAKAWARMAFYYYYKVNLFRYPEELCLPVDENHIDWEHDFFDADVVALEINESVIGSNHPAAFINGLLFAPLPPPISFSYSPDQWSLEEHYEGHTWRWSTGSGRLLIKNNRSSRLKVTLAMELGSYAQTRQVKIITDRGELLWNGEIPANTTIPIPPLNFWTPSGRSYVEICTDIPGQSPGSSDSRLLALQVRDLRMTPGERP